MAVVRRLLLLIREVACYAGCLLGCHLMPQPMLGFAGLSSVFPCSRLCIAALTSSPVCQSRTVCNLQADHNPQQHVLNCCGAAALCLHCARIVLAMLYLSQVHHWKALTRQTGRGTPDLDCHQPDRTQACKLPCKPLPLLATHHTDSERDNLNKIATRLYPQQYTGDIQLGCTDNDSMFTKCLDIFSHLVWPILWVRDDRVRGYCNGCNALFLCFMG